MILQHYVHVLESCDRVNMIVDGVIAMDKPTADTSVEELTEIVVENRTPDARQRERSCAPPLELLPKHLP